MKYVGHMVEMQSIGEEEKKEKEGEGQLQRIEIARKKCWV